MSKYSLTYLMENDMDDMGSSTRLRITKDIVVTPKGDSTIQDLINALNNPNNYGIYLSNLINVNKSVKDKLAAYYGTPNQRIKGNYPEKSATNTSAFIANLLNTDSDLNRLTPVLLGKITNWKQVGSEIQAAPTKTTTKDYIEKVFTTVFNNAGVTYDLKK
jgi:hypothetical protein